MSNKNFLHTIVAPNLTDSNFGQSIQTQFNNINTNFQRLVSAAYLSGQDGNDVVVNDVPIYTEKITAIDRDTNIVKFYDTIDVINDFLNVDDVNYDFVVANDVEDKYSFLYDILQQAVFTDFGLQLVETIFSEHTFELTYHRITSIVDGVEVVHANLGYVLFNEDLEQMFPSYSDTNKYPIWLAFVYNPFVRMFAIHDIDTDTITNVCATQLYYFYDARIGSIQLLDDKDTANDFTDYTSFITISSERNADGEYEINGTYTMSKSQDLPTLYYDNDAQEFCWKMNGIETNITAQGVKGDKGEPAGCWFCRGNATTVDNDGVTMINAKLISYYTTDETGNLILRSVNDENCEIKNGDFVCVDVYNSDVTNNTTYFDTIFGNVEVGTQVTGDSALLVYRVTRPYNTSIMSMINNSPTALYEYLKRINGNGNDDTLHGLFVPSYSSTNVVHMMNSAFVDNNENLIIHPVMYRFVNGALNDDNIPTYNASRKPDFVIDGYGNVDMKSSNLITEGNVECENIDANGSITATVNGMSNVKVGIPIGTVIDYYGNDIPEGWLQINEDESSNNIYQGSDEFEKYKGVIITWVKPGETIPSSPTLGVMALNDVDLTDINFIDSTNGLVFILNKQYLNFIYTIISYDLPSTNISLESSVLKVKISSTYLDNTKDQLINMSLFRDFVLRDMKSALTWPFEIEVNHTNGVLTNDIYMTLYKNKKTDGYIIDSGILNNK